MLLATTNSYQSCMQLTKGLQHSVSLKDLLLNPPRHTADHCTQVLEDELGRLSLACPTLSTDAARLVLQLILPLCPCRRGSGKHVGRQICHAPTTVL